MSDMNYIQRAVYGGLWGGATAMVCLHNTFIAFFLFKARQSNVSNILKIIFNFANFWRFLAAVGYSLMPDHVTLLQCTSLQYVVQLGNFFVRVPLIAFLLWRLRQIRNNRFDNIAGTILFLLRAGLGIVPLAFQRPSVAYDPVQNISVCMVNEQSSEISVSAMIALEFVIDVYVSVRLYQILRSANHNAAQISSNLGSKSKRTLFTAVMYWNFLRLLVSALFHILPLLNYVQNVDDAAREVRDITVKCLTNILLSYVITVDAEIVRVIEGRDKKKGSTTSSDKTKSFKSSPRTPISHYSGGGYSPDLPKYSAQDNSSIVDQDKIVVSMKRLSFFEWANVVVGKRLRRNNNEEVAEDDEEVEEIIEVEGDVEKAPSQNRDSSFSGTTSTTETSTLDGNPEIIVNNPEVVVNNS